MTLQSKSFTINKSATLEQIAQFLESEIGLNAFLIKGIRGVALSTDVTQLTILYEKYASYILDSIAPREGALFTDDVASNDFDIRFLFNEPVNANSITNGTFSIDGQPLTTNEVYVDPTTNNYFLKIHASGAAFQTTDFHTYQINDTLKRSDGSSYNYTPVGGYVFHGISSPHIGDYSEEYISRRRGKLAVGVVKLSKNINPQQGILEFLSQRQLSNNNLITYTPVSSSTNTVTVYFIYIKNLEPQIVSGFPLDNSLLPDVSAPTKVTFVFNTKLDSSKLASVTGLFSVEEGFATSTDVDPSDITLLADRQTVEINTTSYFNGRKVYSILAKPGIRSLEGLDKEKPEQWTIHIAPYEASGVGGSGVSQADFDDLVADFQSHSGLSSIHYETGEISISTGQIPDLPPIIDETRFVALSGAFTGFTGDEFASLSTSVSTNTSNLAVVSGTVVSNTNSISTNASNLAVVSGLVDTNTSDLGYVSGLVDTNTTSIATNETNLAVVSGNVVSNTSNISTNAFNLAVVSGLVDTNTTDLGYVSGLVNTNTANISTNQGNISTNASNLAFVSGLTNTNASNINSLSTDFDGHTGLTSIHYTQGDITDLEVNQLNPGTDEGYVLTSNGSTASWQPPPAVSGVSSGLFASHTGDTNIHFLQGDINHLNITNIGVNSHAAIDTHIADITGHTGETGIHFLQSDITISASQITDVEPSANYVTNSAFAVHTGSGEVHFTVGSINHSEINEIGINSHDAIDTHISSTSNPHSVTAAQVGAPTTTEFNSLSSDVSTNTSNISFVSGLSTTNASNITSLDTELDSASGHLVGLIGNNTTYIGILNNFIIGHTGDSTIHFTKSSISVSDLSGINEVAANSGDIIRYNGSNWEVYATGNEAEAIDGNLSNLTDVNESRKNLKVRYQIDDIVDYSFLAGGRNVGGGGTYLFNLDAYTFMEQDPLNYGVMTATNSTATANGGASRYSNRVGYLVDDLEYYYRVAISHTTSIKTRFGMTYDISTDAHVTGFCPHSVYFEFDSSTDTNWHACATNGTTTTRVDTSFAPTAQSWEWMGFMPVSSGVYFFRYTDATTSEAQALAFIGSSLMPQAGSKGQRVFITTISNGATFRHMLLDKFAYPLNANYLPSGLAIRTFE